MAAGGKRAIYRRAIVAGFGFFSVMAIGAIFNQFVPLILQGGNPEFEEGLAAAGRPLSPVAGLGLAPSVALFIMTWDNLINVFVQPWVGARSDRTWTRFGRRKPWIFLGIPILLVGFLAIPFARTALVIALFILMTNFGLALLRSPTASWLGDLFAPEARSQANGTINIMGGIGAILALFVGGALFDTYGIAGPFAVGAGLLVVAAMVMALGVHEPPPASARVEADAAPSHGLLHVIAGLSRGALLILLAILFFSAGYYAVEAGLSSFAVFSLGISPGAVSIYGGIASIVYILFAFPAGLAGMRYGRLRVVTIAVSGLTFVFFLSYLVIQDDATLVAMLVIFSMLWALINVNCLPLLYDHGDESRIGAYTGLYYFASQLAAVLGPTAGGLIVDWLDNEYRWLFIFSTVFLAFAWLAINRVPLQLQRSRVESAPL